MAAKRLLLVVAALLLVFGCEVAHERRVLCQDALYQRAHHKDAFPRHVLPDREVARYCLTWVGW